MSIPSHTVINVAKRDPARKGWSGGPAYEHFFRVTIERDFDSDEVQRVLTDLVKRYKAPEFEIEATHWSVTGRTMKMGK